MRPWPRAGAAGSRCCRWRSGKAGLPVHPALRDALAAAAASNSYGPVAGHPELRSAAAGYWQRRGLPTRPHAVVCGPGSKALLFGLLLAIGGDVAVPRPSWVSYAAQATMIGVRPHFVPAAPGEGGICDPAALAAAITAAAAGGPLRQALLGAASEIWSAPAAPIQHAAALAFADTPPIRARVARSRTLHATVARAVASACSAAGLLVPPPQAAFYLYPDFEPWRDHLTRRHRVTTSACLAGLLLDPYGAATLPGSAFGDHPAALRLRLATALLYGDTAQQREASLAAPDPLALPWIAAAMARLTDILADLTG